jgi:hypothetical protein
VKGWFDLMAPLSFACLEALIFLQPPGTYERE